MADAPKLQGNEFLDESYYKINLSIDNANEAKKKADNTKVELEDIRVGSDGTVYQTAGHAIREFEKKSLNNENNLSNAIGKIADSVPTSNTSTTGHDLASLTSTITNSKYWNNGFISSESIYLTGIKVKTTATVVSVKIYKKENGGFTFVKDLGDLNVISGIVSVNYLLLKPNYSVFVQFKNGSYYYSTPSGFSSYELLDGVFSQSTVLVSFNLIFSKAGINFFDMSALNGKTEPLSLLLDNLSEFTPSNDTFINKEVDLNSTTLTVTNTRYYSNGAMQHRGFLKGIYLKTNAKTLSVIAGRVKNNTLTLTYNYGDFSIENLGQNGYLSINDDKHYLNTDEYVFIQQIGGTYYFKNSADKDGVQMESDYSGIKTPTGVIIGFNAVIASGVRDSTLSLEKVKGIEGDMETMQQNITDLKTTITKDIMTKKYMPVFENDFSKVNESLTILNDTTGDVAWMFDYTKKYTYPTAKGGYYNDGTSNSALQNILKLNKRYECDMKVLKFDAVLYSDTVLNIHMFRNQHTGEIPNESLYVVDIPNRKIRMTKLTGRNLEAGTYISETNIGFNFVNGNKYQIEIEKRDYEFYFRIKDYVTGAITELKLIGWGAGSQLSYYGFSWGAGSVAPKLSKLSVHMPENPIVAFVGDSITEGYGMNNISGNSSFANRFAELARGAIGDCVISAASSGVISDVIEKFDSEFSIYKPKYLFVTIGTNGNVEMNSIANYTQIKTLCLNNGIKLILNHIPAGGPNATIYFKEKNANIDAVSEDGVKFDIATAVNNDINNGGDSTLFADGIHPNYNGSLKMFNRIKIDKPELFY
ncbi:SGNH/GDSL hydrolase family protein [Bacillus mycoides]|uniref:SGNH/GDSL hydrolase family protein n=1 Tax=Bacillus mycoides TaxID=1405 RepID=UPI003558D86F